MVVQTAPAVRADLGEEFGYPIGTSVTGKMVAALRRLGFDKVFDTDFTADLTILEEGNELLERVKKGGKLPLITSCSPGWIKYCEHNYPEFLDNLLREITTADVGALAKDLLAKKCGVDPAKIFSYQLALSQKLNGSARLKTWFTDVDASNHRELRNDKAPLDFKALPEDVRPCISTGAGCFSEATVVLWGCPRSHEVVTARSSKNLIFVRLEVRRVKEASVEFTAV